MGMQQRARRLGPYLLGEVLGRGSSAIVYRGEDLRSGRAVAVKLLSPGVQATDRERRRLRREVECLRLCLHPNVARVFDAGCAGQLEYVVMELMDGTLADMLREGPLPALEAVRIAVEVLEALTVAHQRGLVHRDVKPANIGIARHGGIKLLDFGIATPPHFVQPTETATQTSQLSFAGTLAYIAPEQLQGDPTDGRADIYSVGAVLYEMLAGHPPFSERQPVRLIEAVLHQTPPPITRGRPDLPDVLAQAVSTALAKRPEQRFATAHQMRGALGAVVEERRRSQLPESSVLDVSLPPLAASPGSPSLSLELAV